jgi:hypothetical protein
MKMKKNFPKDSAFATETLEPRSTCFRICIIGRGGVRSRTEVPMSEQEKSWARCHEECSVRLYGTVSVMENASVRQPLSIDRMLSPLSSRLGFPATLHWTRSRVRLSLKERRMKSVNATRFHRKSGRAKPRDLRFRRPFVEMFFRQLDFFSKHK